ncbi:hypothetical protein CYANOKiyG1_71470 [Okeania sp. KiyG1]|nr:hypothetical protein CYANOKiyG1_71470 [Okeania sp. KiyG1]
MLIIEFESCSKCSISISMTDEINKLLIVKLHLSCLLIIYTIFSMTRIIIINPMLILVKLSTKRTNLLILY